MPIAAAVPIIASVAGAAAAQYRQGAQASMAQDQKVNPMASVGGAAASPSESPWAVNFDPKPKAPNLENAAPVGSMTQQVSGGRTKA